MLHRRVEWYSNFRIEIFLREIRFTWIVVRSSIYNNGERTFEIKKGRVELRSNASVIDDSRKNFSRL